MTDECGSYPAHVLDATLEAAIDHFDSRLEQAWKDPEHGKQVMQIARMFANVFLGAAGKLTVEPATRPWEGLDSALNRLGVRGEVLDAIQVQLALDYATDTRSMAERCLGLAQMAISVKPRPQVLKFLGRVSRCYILGLAPECIILCRAVVEKALEETFDRHQIPVPANAQGKSPMGQRLDAAVKFRWLDTAERQAAWEVWTRGNKNVHDDPDVATDAADTIAKTMRVVDALYADH